MTREKKQRQPRTGSSREATEEVGGEARQGRRSSASHRFCEPIILETKLTMAVAGCSGSSSAKRWLTLSVVLPCLRATKPKSLERRREKAFHSHHPLQNRQWFPTKNVQCTFWIIWSHYCKHNGAISSVTIKTKQFSRLALVWKPAEVGKVFAFFT